MKRRVDKIIDVTPMTKEAAERVLQQPIDNLLHGDMGYMVNDKWIPKHIVDSQSSPFETIQDKLNYAQSELERMICWVESINKEQAKALLSKSKQLYEYLK